MLSEVTNPRRRTWLAPALEAATVCITGRVVKANSAFLEGDGATFIQALPRIMLTKAVLDNPMNSVLLEEINLIAKDAPGSDTVVKEVTEPLTAEAAAESPHADTRLLLILACGSKLPSPGDMVVKY